MECLQRKAVVSKHSQPKREATWTEASKAIGMRLPQPFKAHISPQHAQMLDMEL